MSNKKNEIKELKGFALSDISSEELSEIITANIGETGTISRFDLDKCKVPTGGSTRWEVPTLEGNESQEEIEGIIIHWKDVRAFWQEEYSGGNTPPDCYADDAQTGVGNPGGDCATCPMSQWGSADKGDGQKCKEMRILFLLREDDILPLAIPAPPTSVANIKQYFMRLASKAIPFYGVITSLGLKEAMSNTGVKYSQIDPNFKKRLPKEDIEQIKIYREEIKPRLNEVRVDEREDITEVSSDDIEEAEEDFEAQPYDEGGSEE